MRLAPLLTISKTEGSFLRLCLPGDIDRGAAQIVPLSDQRQGLALAELAATLLEKGGDVSNLPRVDDREKTITV